MLEPVETGARHVDSSSRRRRLLPRRGGVHRTGDERSPRIDDERAWRLRDPRWDSDRGRRGIARAGVSTPRSANGPGQRPDELTSRRAARDVDGPSRDASSLQRVDGSGRPRRGARRARGPRGDPRRARAALAGRSPGALGRGWRDCAAGGGTIARAARAGEPYPARDAPCSAPSSPQARRAASRMSVALRW
jgi:hypothetical protein